MNDLQKIFLELIFWALLMAIFLGGVSLAGYFLSDRPENQSLIENVRPIY